MKLSAVLSAISLASISIPCLASPTRISDLGILEARAPFVNCKPKNGRPYKVSVAHAKAQIQKASTRPGKSGYSHVFGNKEGLKWLCTGSEIYEYPIYWVDKKDKKGKIAEWAKDEKKGQQPHGPTPIRVIYTKDEKYCGVIIHENVNCQKSGSGDFILCV